MHKPAFEVLGEILEEEDRTEYRDTWLEDHITEGNRELVLTLLGLKE